MTTEHATLLIRIKNNVERALRVQDIDAEFTFVTEQMYCIVVKNKAQLPKLKRICEACEQHIVDEFESGVYGEL